MNEAAKAAGYLWLIPALPLAGAAFHVALGRRLGRAAVHFVGPAVVGAAFAVSLFAVAQLWAAPPGTALVDRVYPWIHAGSLMVDVAFRLDALSAVMILVVTGVGFLIHVYSAGYMGEDPDFARYFAYLNLFAGSMLILVLADNLPLLFVGWEGVGLCSYLLIGFWYEKPENAAAGNKAFLVNRIGDFGFLLGIFLLFWSLGPGRRSLSFAEIAARAPSLPPATATAACLLLFLGATGKSAQIPLYVWLPDAMAGPTPVSALIHAATMVTAGVYMIARLHFLYSLSPTALGVVATVGAATAVFAATIALVQTDIKRVLAYSTVSQLGYMFLGVGVGAYHAGIFHLVTHAFFKALLFLGAGSVIHALGGEQDIRKMGGLRAHLPLTYGTFVIAFLAIAGVPGFAGFFSKDEILWYAYASPHGSPLLWAAGFAGAGLTAFYMGRLVFLTFFGESRVDPEARHHIHEAPASMAVPLVVLAVLSVVGGYVGLPQHWLWGNRFERFLEPVVGTLHGAEGSPGTQGLLMALSVAVAAAGIAVAYWWYAVQPGLPALLAYRLAAAYRVLLHKYYVDELYDRAFVRPLVRGSELLWRVFDVRLIDGAVNGTAEFFAANARIWRRWQTGNVQHYALSLFAGAICVLGYLLWR